MGQKLMSSVKKPLVLLDLFKYWTLMFLT